MKITVRATRAYLAGFGTSGSLLAGAAALFVLGSAIVAFRGWPQIATNPATVAVASSHPAAPSRVARRLAAVLRGRLITGGAPIGAALGRRRVTSSVKAQTVTRGSVAPTSGARGAPATSGSSGAAACAASGCNQRGSPGLLSSLTTTVAQEVSSLGSNLGSDMSSGSSTATASVSGVSPEAGSTVQNTAGSTGSTVSGTATTAAGVVTQAGDTAGGGGH